MTVFPSAADARVYSANNLIIFDEVRTLERAILVASDAGNLEAIVNDNTAMTNSTPADATSQSYFNVWQKTSTDRALLMQMNAVIEYFEGKGYSITREVNSNDATVFQWKISW